MSDWVQERYHAYPIAANGRYDFPSGASASIAGFLCVTSGTLTAVKGSGITLINAFPCTAGNYYKMPFQLGPNGYVQLAGGASGALAIS